MALTEETIEVNGAEIDLIAIAGGTVADLVIPKRALLPIDLVRLEEVLSGDLKDSDVDVDAAGETVTGEYLNLVQGRIVEVNKFGIEYFGALLVSKEAFVATLEKAHISTNLVSVVHGLTAAPAAPAE